MEDVLSWEDFRYVKALADTRSLSAAAIYLGVNHSTVFRRLRQIEDALGSRLFERGRAGYTLTRCGEEMVQLATRMGEDIAAFERKVIGSDLRPSGELRITTCELVLRHILLGPLVRFRRTYPDIALELIMSVQLLDLSRRDADVAVRAVYQTPSEGLAGEKLTDLAWAVFGPSTMASRPFDLASAGKERDWVALLDHVAVSRMGGWYKQNVDKTRIICRTNSIAGLVEAVAAGMGLALLPTYIADTIPGLTQLTPPLPELMGELWVLTHPDLYNSARVRTFFDFCAAELDRDRAIVVTAGSLQTESRLTEDKRRRTA